MLAFWLFARHLAEKKRATYRWKSKEWSGKKSAMRGKRLYLPPLTEWLIPS